MNQDRITVEPSVLERIFDAPQQLVFDAWTQVEHLVQWNFPQQGWTCEYTTTDIRPGGSTLHKMVMPNGHEMWLLTKYLEIVAPDRLVFIQYMSNPEGDIVGNPMMPNWPRDIRTTILLESEGDRTKLQLIWEPIDPTQAEADCFRDAIAERGNGWSQGFEQLAAYLAQI